MKKRSLCNPPIDGVSTAFPYGLLCGWAKEAPHSFLHLIHTLKYSPVARVSESGELFKFMGQFGS